MGKLESWPPDWPPSHFAVLQNRDGLEPYFRPMKSGEPLEQFCVRIGEIVAVGSDGPLGKTFVDAIEGSSGASDIQVRNLILLTIEHQKRLRNMQSEETDLS